MTSRKTFLLRLLLVATSFVVAVLAADWLVRAVDLFGISYYRDVQRYLSEAIEPPPGQPEEVGPTGRIFQNRGEVHLALKTFDYRTDAFGFRRGAEETGYTPEETGKQRWLFLGDSVTLAWGVDDEDSWIRALERETSADDGRALRCLNAGHLMYETVQQASLLRHHGPVHRPAFVGLMFISNDIQPTWDQVLEMTGAAEGAGAEDDGGFGWSDSFLARALPGFNGIRQYFGDLDRFAEGRPGAQHPSNFYDEGWPRCAGALDAMRASCALLGSRLVVFDHTTPPMPQLAAWCESSGVLRIGTRFTPEESALDIRNSKVDAHANAFGNRLIADKVIAGLRAAGILAP